jgi:hypothetical protein
MYQEFNLLSFSNCPSYEGCFYGWKGNLYLCNKKGEDLSEFRRVEGNQVSKNSILLKNRSKGLYLVPELKPVYKVYKEDTIIEVERIV